MGFYSRHFLPRLLDLAMRRSDLLAYRTATVSAARGTVVEIGIGSGLNLPLYGSSVVRVSGIDPSPELLAMVHSSGKEALDRVVLLRAYAERLPISSECADTVVMTWTLCTIPDPINSLSEIRRVLKPGGRLLFVEHGYAPEPNVQGWQNRLTPFWRRIAGGCHLNRRIDALIQAGGFRIDEIRTGYAKGPRAMAFMYRGSAVPR